MKQVPLRENERKEIVSWIRSLFVGPLLCETGFPSAYGGPGGGDLLPELADYAPLLAAAGEVEFARKQAELSFQILSADPLFRGPRTRASGRGVAFRLLQLLKATHLQDYAEILLGYLQLYRVTGDRLFGNYARWLARFIRRQFESKGGIAAFFLHGRMPVYQAINGNVIEFFLDCADLLGDGELRKAALASLTPYLQNPCFEKQGLWPSLIVGSPRFPTPPIRPFNRLDLAKANVAMATALLRAYRATGAIEYERGLRHFIETGLGGLRAPTGGLYTLAHVKGRGLELWPHVNTSNHAALELLIDAWEVLRDDKLAHLAEELADFWLDQIHGETGLMPDVAGGTESFVDSNTDFAVLYRKLFKITEKPEYLRASEGLMAAVARYHRQGKGLVCRTYVATGAVADETIETRYTSLFLKPLLLADPPPGLPDAVLTDLMRDR